MIEFFCLTPLPGSEDHQKLWTKGIAMDADLNRYDLEHVCAAHPRMSQQEWEAIYREAWSLYYTPDHMKTLLRRAAATGVPMRQPGDVLVPLRDHGAARERASAARWHPPAEASVGAAPRAEASTGWLFWLRFLSDSAMKYGRAIAMFLRVARWRRNN